MKRLTSLVYRFPLPIIIVFAAITLFFGYWIKDLRVNSDVVSYLPREDGAVRLFHRLDERFGGNDLVMAAFQSPRLFSPGSLRDIQRLTEAFQSAPGVSSVTSLTNVMDIRKAADGGLEIGLLVDPENLPSTDAEAAALSEQVMKRDRYRGSLVSEDGTATLIIAQLQPGTDKSGVVRSLQSAAATAGPHGTLYFGGIPYLVAELAAVIFHDFALLIPIVALLIIATLYVSFRTVRGVVIPLLAVAISTVWVLGLMGLLKVPLTLVSDIIPAILIAVGTAPCIHILSKFDEDTSRYGDRGEKAQGAFREVGTRVILAAVTIVLGFSSFIIGSYLTTIRDFGIFTSLGVCFSLLVSVMFVPAVLSVWKVKPRVLPAGLPPRSPKLRLVDRAMRAWSEIVVRRRRTVLVVSAVVLAVSIAGIPFIQRKADFVEFFGPTSPVRITDALLARQFGGSRPLQVSFSGDVQNPFVLKEMLRMERFLTGEGLARNPVSAADLVLEMNEIMDDRRTIPDDQGKVTNLLFFLEGQEMAARFLAADGTDAQVQAMVGPQDVAELKRTVHSIETYIGELDTRLVPLTLSSLSPGDRHAVLDFQARRQAEVLRWLARTHRPGLEVDVKGVGTMLERLYAPQGSAPSPLQPLPAVLGQFPPSLAQDAGFARDAEGVLQEMSQATVAVPERLFAGLEAARGAHPSAVSFGVGFTGMPLISWHLDQSILESQGESLLIALVFIFALLALKLRSIRGGLLGLVPIVMAIVVVFAVMGFAGIPINVATVLVGSIALGIGIDYVIHFTVRFTTYYRGPGTVEDAVRKTIQTTGQAIVINVLAVTMGFITLLFAGLVPLRQFGALTAIAMIASGVGAFTLLPSLIMLVPSAFTGRGRKRQRGSETALAKGETT